MNKINLATPFWLPKSPFYNSVFIGNTIPIKIFSIHFTFPVLNQSMLFKHYYLIPFWFLWLPAVEVNNSVSTNLVLRRLMCITHINLNNPFLYGILLYRNRINFDATAIQIYLFYVLRFRSNALEEISWISH